MPLECLDCRGKFGGIVHELRCSLCGQLYRLRQLLLSERFPSDGVPVVEPQVKAALFTALEVSDSFLSGKADKGDLKGSSAPETGSGDSALLEATAKSKAKGRDGGDRGRADRGGDGKKSAAEESEEKDKPKAKSHQGERRGRSRTPRRRRERRDSRTETPSTKGKEKARGRERGERSEESEDRDHRRRKEESEEERSRTPQEGGRREKGKDKPRSPSQPPPGRGGRASGQAEKERSGRQEKNFQRRPPRQGRDWRGPIYTVANRPRSFRDHPGWDPNIKYTNKGRQKWANQEARREQKGRGKGSAWQGL